MLPRSIYPKIYFYWGHLVVLVLAVLPHSPDKIGHRRTNRLGLAPNQSVAVHLVPVQYRIDLLILFVVLLYIQGKESDGENAEIKYIFICV